MTYKIKIETEYCKKVNFEGYTLVEVLVAVSLFSLLIVGPAGLFISSLKNQTKALALRETVDNISYTINYIGRALRMARKDDVDIEGTIDCLSGDKVNYEITNRGDGGIKFRNYKNQCQEFFLEGGQIKERKGNNGGNILELTSVDLEITNLNFSILGETQDNNIQPRVTMFLEIKKRNSPNSPVTKLQTTVSQRNLDIFY